ncbi:MAG: NAD(P)-dependent oxidoreductase [Gammaproteobacteria bacterium]|nr:NAD(P)-dependent oxidoreductase [Gammaproteobacteria bacterium]MBI5616475.1 NAD(P)-dependent oxidoreductase [Gammaproteobacteria bacterium]
MTQHSFGFVGVGRMGSLMSARLLQRGHEVHVHDVSPAAVAALQAEGAQAAPSACSVGDRADVVFLSLPNPDIVREACLQSEGLIAGSRVRRVVDFSTIGPRMAASVATGLAARDIVYVDAPVSGGLKGAREGTLAVMVSCARAVYEELESLLALFGKPFHLGERAGQAQTMKLANNLLAAAALAVTSEAMVMGVKAGLAPQVMLDVLNAGSGRNSAAQDKFPRAILPGTFDFGFATGLSYKDVRLCIDEAEAMGVPMVCGAAVRQMLAVTNAMYGADSDFTSICRVVESWAGVEVRG